MNPNKLPPNNTGRCVKEEVYNITSLLGIVLTFAFIAANFIWDYMMHLMLLNYFQKDKNTVLSGFISSHATRVA